MSWYCDRGLLFEATFLAATTGTSLDKFRFEYIVYGDFLCKSPYILATSAYWVPLSKLVKNVTRAKAVAEIEIFEGNMEAHRSDELDELESEDDEEDDE